MTAAEFADQIENMSQPEAAVRGLMWINDMTPDDRRVVYSLCKAGAIILGPGTEPTILRLLYLYNLWTTNKKKDE